MNVLLVAINSKFVHTNLAVRYLEKACYDIADVDILENSINTDKNIVLKNIYLKKPDIICFSCYIWNIDYMLEIAGNIKKVMPEVHILFGGPEVSFDPEKIMLENSFIDLVLSGEGEESLRELIMCMKGRGDYESIDGLTFRKREDVVKNAPRELINDMGSVRSPYEDMDEGEYKDKIIYYESSRGCPFNCQYCMSSTIRGVRNFPLERVKKELKEFVDANVKQVKFVDRTFNANRDRTLEMIAFLKENDNGYTNFHFEVAAHIMDDELIRALSDSRRGLFQIEIGIQSTNPNTLAEICRSQDFGRIRHVVGTIAKCQKVHQHVDLIAGLPYEGYESFARSFDDVFSIGADHVQLGFLKLLKGSPIRENQISKHGYEFSSKPPYEILSNKYIGFGEILRLKEIEEILELYWNSRGFSKSCTYVIENFYSESPFRFFEDFSRYWSDRGYFEVGHSRNALYEMFSGFYEFRIGNNMELFRELLRHDYMASAKASAAPKALGGYDIACFKGRCYEFVSSPENVSKYMGMYSGLDSKGILRKIRIEAFSYDIKALFGDMKTKPVKKDTFVLYVYDGVDSLLEKSNVYFIEI
ncbi:Radical SAM superfamily enzyme YgiQ, UPF0313 family [Peptoclostridium litorale DSM 5388]|uniref:Radical SAM superfamily protein n=1 Tax=Peptoclostridium litorale DSM 5388 TaxID=1121324 RepID=A0A069RG63_PEPLI|nr:B12-binding domain-containing radical SAM protein [Peptoclostridium litorale]KDR96029.1 radical SAM superfamily protein [Peptoclostridium litorale DSM 5388]SIO06280.1 Radical SAM superfamily enzyme YgiQ, UPF0313 family [Peptoclostridium litorale DSM 5388]